VNHVGMRRFYRVNPAGLEQTSRGSFPPLLAPVLMDRRITVLFLAVGVFQVLLHFLGIPGWTCPVKTFLGVPCPGCGLTRGIGHLLHGEWGAAISNHAFSPLFLAGGCLVGLLCLVPGSHYTSVVRWVAVLESRTGIVLLFFSALLCYWGFRVVECLRADLLQSHLFPAVSNF